MKCRSCGPRYSSAWVPDAKKLGWITEQDKVWNIEAVNDTTNFDFLKASIKDVEKIYFAGGEPLLMKEHWDILDMLVEAGRFDVKICYNTNMLKLDYGNKNVLDYWAKWQPGKIEIWPSIDELGERAELIRSGTVWSKVDANLRELVKLKNISVRPGITVGAWNVGRLPEIIEYFCEIGILNQSSRYRNFYINLLEIPSPYHVHVLPPEYRAGVIAKLNKFITQHNTKYGTKIDDLFKHILHELRKPHNYQDTVKFIRMTKQIDDVRGENLYEVIPEMEAIVDWEENRKGRQ
jgi:sulfatase maturation enzyme AslB (radical SAM superfamily)